MSYFEYTPTARELPPKDVWLEWITPGGVVVRGKFAGGAVWFPEGSSMYVYYTPTFWRRVDGQRGFPLTSAQADPAA